MRVTGKGYIFQCNIQNGVAGVKEEFKCTEDSNFVTVDCLVGLGMNFCPVAPAIVKEGQFVALWQYINNGSCGVAAKSQEDFARFLRSNKPTYSVFNPAIMLCRLQGKFNKIQGMWEDKTTVDCYVPKVYGKDKYGEPIVCCNRLDVVQGLNTNIVDAGFLNMAKNSVMQYAVQYNSRDSFLSRRASLYA